MDVTFVFDMGTKKANFSVLTLVFVDSAFHNGDFMRRGVRRW